MMIDRKKKHSLFEYYKIKNKDDGPFIIIITFFFTLKH